jgi:hypothetical protein
MPGYEKKVKWSALPVADESILRLEKPILIRIQSEEVLNIRSMRPGLAM